MLWLINMSLLTGEYPDSLKLVKIIQFTRVAQPTNFFTIDF